MKNQLQKWNLRVLKELLEIGTQVGMILEDEKEAAKLAEINAIETITIAKGGKLETKHYPKWQLISSH